MPFAQGLQAKIFVFFVFPDGGTCPSWRRLDTILCHIFMLQPLFASFRAFLSLACFEFIRTNALRYRALASIGRSHLCSFRTPCPPQGLAAKRFDELLLAAPLFETNLQESNCLCSAPTGSKERHSGCVIELVQLRVSPSDSEFDINSSSTIAMGA